MPATLIGGPPEGDVTEGAARDAPAGGSTLTVTRAVAVPEEPVAVSV